MSHGDLWLDNILWDGHRIWLLDWECAGMSHPYRDLAKICIAGEIAPARRLDLLRSYCGTVTSEDAQALADLVQTELLLHIAWCLAHADAGAESPHHDADWWLHRFFQEKTADLK
jgi:thiamine kinase-like enzyme